MHVDVSLAQGGQAEALVGLGVFVVADADRGFFHDPDHRRQHLLARKAVAAEVVVDPASQPRQGAAEIGHAAVFGLVAMSAPVGVVDVLLAAALVAAASNTSTTPTGALIATRPNTAAWPISASQPRQGAAEIGHAAVFGLVAMSAPVGVVDVLLAAALVAAGGLDMTAGVGTDPDVGPGRRDHQPGDAVLGAGVVDGAAIRIEIGKALAGLAAGDARVAVVHIDEAGRGGFLGTLQDIGRHGRSRTRRPETPGTFTATGAPRAGS